MKFKLLLIFTILFVSCDLDNETLNYYTVTFNSNSGSTVSSQTVIEGYTVTEPSDPTRTDYTFNNWYSDSSLTTLWDFDSNTVTSDITLYAGWKKVINEFFINKDSSFYLDTGDANGSYLWVYTQYSNYQIYSKDFYEFDSYSETYNLDSTLSSKVSSHIIINSKTQKTESSGIYYRYQNVWESFDSTTFMSYDNDINFVTYMETTSTSVIEGEETTTNWTQSHSIELLEETSTYKKYKLTNADDSSETIIFSDLEGNIYETISYNEGTITNHTKRFKVPDTPEGLNLVILIPIDSYYEYYNVDCEVLKISDNIYSIKCTDTWKPTSGDQVERKYIKESTFEKIQY
jgi:uncharacterized repeat protein (TIGR02543 family)